MHRITVRILALALSLPSFSVAFIPHKTTAAIRPGKLFSSKEEAEALLERARKMREEVAALEGRSIEDVEQEAQLKRQQQKKIQEKAAVERKEMKEAASKRSKTDGRFLNVPETPEDQVLQAKGAIERAFRDGITRQVVRWALVPEGEVLNEDRLWPGGAQQMYREAAGPLTRNLLRQVRARTSDDTTDSELTKQPKVTSQDIWDFDGSALITAEAVAGAKDDVQAMVLPNTDNKYTRDIAAIDKAMGDRLFLLVNPFWRDVDSWGFNLLAPKGKQMAQEAIFDRGFEETYVLLQKSVQGEDCIALKAYPYDWQLYAYAESDYWPYAEYIVHLGSTPQEPRGSDFAKLLGEREEFKLSKNMRQMQRMMNKDE